MLYLLSIELCSSSVFWGCYCVYFFDRYFPYLIFLLGVLIRFSSVLLRWEHLLLGGYWYLFYWSHRISLWHLHGVLVHRNSDWSRKSPGEMPWGSRVRDRLIFDHRCDHAHSWPMRSRRWGWDDSRDQVNGEISFQAPGTLLHSFLRYDGGYTSDRMLYRIQ